MNNVLPISNVRANLPEIVTKVSSAFDRVTITVNGRPKAVLVSAEELASLEETAEILCVPGAKKSIMQGVKEAKEGQGIPLSQL
jgi:antitoxin YefM